VELAVLESERNEPVRADARRNRARIIEVAQDAFTTSGDVSLNSIAKKAGVGPGTLYRHFPTREALILAVYRHEVEQLAAYAPELLKEHPPLEALRLWWDRLAYYGRIKHGLSDVLHALTDDGLAGETYGPIIGAVTVLLRACEENGSIPAGRRPGRRAADAGLPVADRPRRRGRGAGRAAARPGHRRPAPRRTETLERREDRSDARHP
jgi:AcrR family transcriptional regulator